MFETFAAVMMLIVFLVPGYIWRTVEGQLVWLDRKLEWEKFALGLLVRSTFIYLPCSPWIYLGWTEKWYDNYPLQTAGFAVFFYSHFAPSYRICRWLGEAKKLV